MAFLVSFFNHQKAENSTALPSGAPLNLDCVLKDSCSIVNPILKVDIGRNVAPTWNYCFIEPFGRYYFVENWTWEVGLWNCSLSIDSLASYKTYIGNSSGYIVRSSYNSNGAISDSYYPASSEIRREVVTADTPWSYSANSLSYVVGANGTGQTAYYGLDSGIGLTRFLTDIFSDRYAESVVNDWANVYPQIKAQLNPLQYITSFIALPFDVTGGQDNNVQISVGWGSATANTVVFTGIVFEFNIYFAVPKHPQASRGVYLNAAPFSSYRLLVPPFGEFTLSSTDLYDSQGLYCLINVDPTSGSATMRVRVGAPNAKTISVAHASVGRNVQLSYTIAPGIGTMDVLEAGVATASSIVSLNPTGFASSALSSIRNMAGSLIPSSTSSGTNSGNVDTLLGSAELIADFLLIADEDNENRGRPLMTKGILGDYPGYQIVADPNIRIPGTIQEERMIESFLTGGYFYE